MSFSFTVRTQAPLPRFADVVKEAAFPWPVQVAAAREGGDWPQGRITRISDASSRPEGPLATDSEEQVLNRLGLGLTFLLYAKDHSSRGIEVLVTSGRVNVRVLSLASIADYQIAVRLAAAVAKLAGARVDAEHGPDGHELAPVDPANLSELFDDNFARRNGVEMSQGLSKSLPGEIWVYTWQGWCQIPRTSAHGDIVEQLTRGALLAKGGDTDRVAELLLGAMLFAIAADGQVTNVEMDALRALVHSVPELRSADIAALLPNAGKSLATAASHPESVRKKAMVLGIEAVTRGVLGNFGPADANVRAIQALAAGLGVSEDFAADALFAARCKYVEGDVDAEMALGMVEAINFVASADGTTNQAEALAIAITLATVPQFAGRDAVELLTTTRDRLSQGADATLARLAAFTKFRDKTVALATEVAFAGGITAAAEAALATIEQAMKPTEKLPRCARTAWAAKYAG